MLRISTKLTLTFAAIIGLLLAGYAAGTYLAVSLLAERQARDLLSADLAALEAATRLRADRVIVKTTRLSEQRSWSVRDLPDGRTVLGLGELAQWTAVPAVGVCRARLGRAGQWLVLTRPVQLPAAGNHDRPVLPENLREMIQQRWPDARIEQVEDERIGPAQFWEVQLSQGYTRLELTFDANGKLVERIVKRSGQAAKLLPPPIRRRIARLHPEGTITASGTTDDGFVLVVAEPDGSERSLHVDPAARQTRLMRLSAPLPQRTSQVLFSVGRPLQQFEPALALLRLALFGGLIVGLGVVVLVGRLLTSRSLRPIRRIVAAAEKIDQDHLDQRIAVGPADEIGQLAVTMNHMLERIQAGYVRLKRFTDDVSHELRNPLAAAAGELELALRRPRDPKGYQQAISRALGQVRQLEATLDGLLFLSRSDRAELVLRRQRLDLVELLRQTPARLGQAAARLRLNLPAGPVILTGDPALLGRLIDNLVDNALTYSPAETPVEISLVQADDHWHVLVRDHGPGIRPEHRQRVFEPFFRCAGPSSETHRGLGLPIARRIAELHGGRIELADAPDGGCLFTVVLPVSNPAS